MIVREVGDVGAVRHGEIAFPTELHEDFGAEHGPFVAVGHVGFMVIAEAVAEFMEHGHTGVVVGVGADGCLVVVYAGVAVVGQAIVAVGRT